MTHSTLHAALLLSFRGNLWRGVCKPLLAHRRLFGALLLSLGCTSSIWADSHEADSSAAIPDALHFTSEGSVRINGTRIDYDTVAGQLLMHDKQGKPIALFGYTAYTRKGGNVANRPVLFAYNGGPGSASMWLHMGILGPQRTDRKSVV